MDGYGALAAMGGIFTTVEDLTRWVAGFLDAFPPRDDPDDRHPLSRATRREMQQPMVPEVVRLSHASADAMPEVEGLHYGFGLFQVDDVRFGRTIGHSGGYPGFGSHMRWHPASGLGLIAFANHRYGPASPLARDMMNELLRDRGCPAPADPPEHATLAARETVERLIEDWDDELAAATFAMNVELDEPLEHRKAAIEKIQGAARPTAPRRGDARGIADVVPPPLVAHRRPRPRQGRAAPLAGAPAQGPDVRAHLRARGA